MMDTGVGLSSTTDVGVDLHAEANQDGQPCMAINGMTVKPGETSSFMMIDDEE
jgi:hypothetical protein